jgi:hypothetical protein
MRNQPRNIRPTEALVDLLARRPELRDVGIAGYLVGAAVEGAPGMPHSAVVSYAGVLGLIYGEAA